MRTPARHLRIPAVVVAGVFVLGLAACGDDSSSEPTTNPPTTAPAATSATTVAGLIEVTVGVDSGEDRIETVKVGQPITLKITDPNNDDEFHVHVVDLGDGETVPKGTTKTFSFTPKAVGDIEVESHSTEAVLVIIRVVA